MRPQGMRVCPSPDGRCLCGKGTRRHTGRRPCDRAWGDGTQPQNTEESGELAAARTDRQDLPWSLRGSTASLTQGAQALAHRGEGGCVGYTPERGPECQQPGPVTEMGSCLRSLSAWDPEDSSPLSGRNRRPGPCAHGDHPGYNHLPPRS